MAQVCVGCQAGQLWAFVWWVGRLLGAVVWVGGGCWCVGCCAPLSRGAARPRCGAAGSCFGCCAPLSRGAPPGCCSRRGIRRAAVGFCFRGWGCLEGERGVCRGRRARGRRRGAPAAAPPARPAGPATRPADSCSLWERDVQQRRQAFVAESAVAHTQGAQARQIGAEKRPQRVPKSGLVKHSAAAQVWPDTRRRSAARRSARRRSRRSR